MEMDLHGQSEAGLIEMGRKAMRPPKRPPTRDETKALEWATTAMQFFNKSAERGIKIPFTEICFCVGRIHKHGEAPDRRLVTSEGEKGVIPTRCPVIAPKTQKARMIALGALLRQDSMELVEEQREMAVSFGEAVNAR
jgi:hypothetical protein